MHARQQIREAFAGRLSAAPTTSHWKSVFETRIPPKHRAEPYLLVYVDSEPVVTTTIHPSALQERTAEIVVQGLLLLTDKQAAEDRIDAMSEEIEKRITTTTLQGVVTCQSVALVNTEIELVGEDENKPTHAVLTMTWQVTYTTAEGSPQNLI